MPVKKKLDKKKLAHYKKLLIKLREDLVHDIKNLSKDSSGDDESADAGHTTHMADAATDMYDKEFSLGIASKDRELLNKIEDALRRIEEGTYGFCLGTGKPISQARLEAIPYAEHCLEHQEELEKEQG